MSGNEELVLLIKDIPGTAASFIHGNFLTLHTPLESVSLPYNKADNQAEVKFTSCSRYHRHTGA